MANRHKIIRVLMMILSAATTGCRDHTDARIEQVMRESLERQAEQNRHIAEQSRLSADSVRRVVEAESETRTEVVDLQRDIVERDNEERERLAELTQSAQNNLNAERVGLDKQRASLEQERQQLAVERSRDPIIAQMIGTVGVLVACTIPLLLAGYVFYSLTRGSDDESIVNEILLSEVTANCPTFLSQDNPRLANQPSDPNLQSGDSD